MSIEKSSFGKIEDGTEIFRYTCTNQHGLKLQVMTYGATVTAMDVPDKDGNLSNVTLGFDSLDGYLSRHPYFGSTVGRFCNRIGAGKFSIDGADYQLATNNGPNHLHGGEKGFDAVVWDAEEIEAADTVGVKFTYRSPDGEEGYPGNVDVTAIYSLNNDNEVTMEFSAMTDKATPINLTNHCYWNLGGAGSGMVLEHDLTIPADWYLPGDANLLPTGEIADVEGTQFDFRAATPIGSRIDQLPGNPDAGDPGGYDNCYCLAAQDGTLQLAARVRALDDERPKYKNNLGLVYAHQGRHAEALATFDQAGSKAEAHYNLAYVLGTQGDAEGASQHMQLALDANPQHEAAREALAALANPTSDQDTGDGREGRKSKAVSASGNWVRYVESGASSNELAITDLTDGSSTESLGAQLSARSANRSAIAATRTMHERARATLRNRVAAAKESVSDMAPPLSPVNHVQ